MVPEITRDELKKLIDEKGDYILIDVREKDELENGVIPTSHHIPLDEVDFALEHLDPVPFKRQHGFDKFDEDANLIFYCRTGARSEKATEVALELGFENAKNFKGSVLAWSEIDPNVKMYGD